MKTKTKQPTRATLARRVKELEAQLACAYHFADSDLRNMARKSYTGSALLVEITALGGAEVLRAIAIRDGLSPETIAALRADIVRSYGDSVAFKPEGVTQ